LQRSVDGAERPSSMSPSQSLSWPSQTSVAAPVPPLQTMAPRTHAKRPKVHAPTLLPHTARGPVPGITPPAGASSTTPLQSSSRLLQISEPGADPPTQRSAPRSHTKVPGRHTPMLGPQAVPTIAGMSSVRPLQSLSRPSQTSGPRVPVASPQESSQPSVGSPLRSTKPRAQLATPQLPATHDAVALTAGHTRPHAPQLATSVIRC
jgi:hypothetical protein